MQGAEEFVTALITDKAIWPNGWGQDVAAAAFSVHSERDLLRELAEKTQGRDRELDIYRRQWLEMHSELSNAQALIGLRNARIVELELRVMELESGGHGKH